MCTHVFYDLASAFDTVEFCVLLQSLFHAGIKGKCWRLLCDWYCNLTRQVKLGRYMSEPFAICRGIRQGSIPSPMLFNLVMDPLLSEMRSKSLGISINSLFLGAFARADDLRTMASSNNPLTSSLKIDDVTSLPLEKSVKRLGVWWDNSTSSHACIKERIQKARDAFFPMVN